jgi:hypothetical protein
VADGDDVVVVLVVVVTVVDTTVTEVGGLSTEAGATTTFVAVELRALHPIASHAVAAKYSVAPTGADVVTTALVAVAGAVADGDAGTDVNGDVPT